jgi:HK97 family phage prohead protease
MTSLSDFSGRLITLNDGRAGIRGGMHVEIREPSDSQPSTLNSQPVLDFIASDESLDRYNETISAAGWKLGNYQRNPVFQNAHQHGDIIHTLGRAITTEVRVGTTSTSSPCLFQRIQFATDINPMAKIAYNLYRGKFLNAVSVGFVPIRWENGTEKTAYTRKFVEQELLEVSAVAIPANPNALTLGLKSGAIEKSDLRDCYDLFRLTLESSPSSSNPPDQPSTLNSQLIQLALEFHRLLKS